MNETQYERMLWACIRSQRRLQDEARATINLLGLVSELPVRADCASAIEAQLRREKRAQAEYRRRLRMILETINADATAATSAAS